jgi:hypothetical protein
MSAAPPEHDDDDALSWGDADDATHVDAAHNPVAVRERVGRDTDALALTASTAYVAGVDAVLTGFVEVLRFLSIVAPALWFAVVLWVARSRRTRTRLLWMLLGAVVLFPWPFLMTRSFG